MVGIPTLRGISRSGAAVRVAPLGALLAVYLAVACLLVFRADLVLGDAVSRVGNAYYVLFSRDPHLAAIGFVWGPLPSLTELPLVALHGLWPPLAQRAFAGNLVSAGFMLGAVFELWACVRLLGARGWLAALLTLGFAADPFVVFYAANGMSEAMFLFFTLLALRHLLAWLQGGGVKAQAWTGIALAAAYLTRYEVVPAAVAVGVLVLAVSAWRERGSGKALAFGLCDAAIVLAPFALAFVSWTIASWIIVGHPFEQFTSVYGNSEQMRVAGQAIGAAGLSLRSRQAVASLLAMQPAAALALGLAIAVAGLRRDIRAIAVFAVLGVPFCAMLAAFLTGAILASARYLILVVPLTVLLAALVATGPVPRGSAPVRWARGRRLLTAGAASAAVLAALSALPAGILQTTGSDAAGETATLVHVVLGRPGNMAHGADRIQLAEQRAIAEDLDSLDMGRGTILADTFGAFQVVLASGHPERFVITNDRDFKQVLADPAGSGIQYLLIPEPVGLGSLDAINQAYPGIYNTGAGLATEVPWFQHQGWRLYSVRQSP